MSDIKFPLYTIVIHKKKRTIYKVLETPATHSVRINGDWIPGYFYRSTDEHKTYSRTKEDFETNFEGVS